MKRLTLFLFIALYVFSATEMSQLLKAPFLYQHYTKHQAENHALTFSCFLKMHYMDYEDDKVDEDNAKLPFKSHDSLFSLNAISTALPQIEVIEKLIFREQNTPNHYFENLFVSLYLANVWQPPKI